MCVKGMVNLKELEPRFVLEFEVAFLLLLAKELVEELWLGRLLVRFGVVGA